MIEDKVYKQVLESGLVLDHYFLLCNIKNGKKPIESRRIQGFTNLLEKKGYLYNNMLTEKGEDLVQHCEFAEVITVTETTTEKEMDFATWALELHQKCQDQIFALTGMKQVRPRIMDKTSGRKKSYPFLCNPTDLAKKLISAVTTYKLKDFALIEKTILNHIRECAKTNEWFPLVHYYIMKEGYSNMVTDMQEDGGKENNENTESTQKFL